MDDLISRSVDINAPIDRVWDLVSEPGWWINEGALGGHRLERSGEECLVRDEQLGDFLLGIGPSEPPHRAVFTWMAGGDDVPRTTIEFTLEQIAEGTVRLTVTESGFAAMTPEEHRANFGENESGWEQELGVARDALQSPGAGSGASGA